MPPLFFAPFTKIDPQPDGTLRVYGIASSEAEDSDGEIIKADAVRGALPDYLKFGAVREMHQSVAAGTALEARVDDAGLTHFGAHVVDPTSVLKVQTGVLKGFSLGGTILKRSTENHRVIESIRLTEISLVDRPANPDAVINLVKLDDAGETRMPLAKSMYSVHCLAECLEHIRTIACDMACDRHYEQDASGLPEAVRAWLGTGIELMQRLTAEETTALFASLPTPTTMAPVMDSMAGMPSGGMAMAATPGDVEKAGRRYSAATASALKDMHTMVAKLNSMFAELKYEAADDAEPDDDAAEKVAKAADATPVTSPPAEIEALHKVNADLTAKLAEQDAHVEALRKSVEQLIVQRKGALKIVEKSDDTGGLTPPAEQVDEKDPKALIKLSHQHPIYVYPAPTTRTTA